MPLEEEHKSTVSEDNNSPPHLQLKFQKPTVSEYLQQLSFHEKVRDPHTEKLCRVVWDAFVSMSNENRNHLLKGLVERSSENQLDFVRTMLRIEKSGSTLKSNEKWTEGKETVSHFNTIFIYCFLWYSLQWYADRTVIWCKRWETHSLF